MSYDSISKNDVGYAMHLVATHAKAYTGKHTHTRWESDGRRADASCTTRQACPSVGNARRLSTRRATVLALGTGRTAIHAEGMDKNLAT
jgi:hypothetical protein